MNIDFVINAITAITPASVLPLIKAVVSATASPLINQALSQESVIRGLQQLGLAKIQPGSQFQEIYSYALVDYSKYNSESTLNFFRNKENKEAFWKAVVAFNDEEWHVLKAKAQKAQIDWVKVEEFYEVFIKVANRSINPEQVIVNTQIQEQLKTLQEILAALKTLPEDIAKSQLKESVKDSLYPDEFKALIEEKTKAFCGRVFVFNEFDKFLENHPRGYFTVIGDAGMGKSAIAAESVLKYKAICYFNILVQGDNTPEKFLKSIRQQLINRYQLENAENDNLPSLLTTVNKKLATGERLVIVVDALDEVEQKVSENILDLPKYLPEKIYFLLTRRPYVLDKKYLFTEGVTEEELNLTDEEYVSSNRADVREYIGYCISDEPERKYRLKKWIQSSNLSVQRFIDELVVKSENNFMYLRYVLQGIAEGIYNDLTIDKLPKGLWEYYEQHWLRMDMDKNPQDLMVIVLFILVRLTTLPTLKMIAEITGEEQYEIQKILDKWVEYLKNWEIEGQMCYSIYHTSFLDFLKAKRDLQRTRKLFQQVDERISDYLY
ncbi:MAG: NACHT domain protein [Nostoc sp. S4]|nr:NACHT domain protein [Nostoc sp. S4]